MFCHKCGTKIPEKAAFCPKCGAKTIIDESDVQPVAASAPANQTRQSDNTPVSAPKKKKSKKRSIILGIGALVVILFILASIGGNEGNEQRSSSPSDNKQPSSDNTITANTSTTAPEVDDPSETTDGLLFRGIPADQLLGTSYDDMIRLLGEPDSTMFEGEENYYGDVTIYFDMWSWDRPYLSGVNSGSLEDFTYNGHPLSDNYDELSQILGREPDSARVFYDTYDMSYTWEHMGSEAFLTVSVPATEESPAATQVSISWWHESYDFSDDPDVPANNLPVLPDGFEWAEAPSGSTKSFGYGTDLIEVKITGVIKNTSGSTKSYVQIMFNCYDSNGYQIGEAWDNINNLGDGKSWKFDATFTDTSGTVTSFEFASLSGW